MHTVTVSVPDSVSQNELQMIVASQLYARAELSLGQAAELAGLSKREFMTRLGRYGVSAFNYTAEEMRNEYRSTRRNA